MRDTASGSPRLSVDSKKSSGLAVCGGMLAGPNVFIASMKRPETPVKATNTKTATERESSGLFVPPALCCSFVLC